jgi:hypothetical protein
MYPKVRESLMDLIFAEGLSSKVKFLTFSNNDDKKCISNYHIGYIYDLELPHEHEDLLNFIQSNEPLKNTAIVYDMKDGVPDNADSWLAEIIRYYSTYGVHKFK